MTSYDRLLDVLRQLAQFELPDRPIVLRFILRHVTTHTIIIRYHNFGLKMILRHILG